MAQKRISNYIKISNVRGDLYKVPEFKTVQKEFADYRKPWMNATIKRIGHLIKDRFNRFINVMIIPFMLTRMGFPEVHSEVNMCFYNGKEFQNERSYISWSYSHDYRSKLWDSWLSKWHTFNQSAEKYFGLTSYAFRYHNQLKLIDSVNGGKYYNKKGKMIGQDSDVNSATYIVMDNKEVRIIKTNNKREGFTPRSELKSIVAKPSSEVMNSANISIQNTIRTGNEHGFVAATDGTTSSVITNNNGDHVQLGPCYQELEGKEKASSFDVHTHLGKKIVLRNGNFSVDNCKPSGNPGDTRTDNDFGYREMKENQGQVSEPSWIIGTNNFVDNARGDRVINPSPEIIVTFYNSNGIVGQMSWSAFQRTVNKITDNR